MITSERQYAVSIKQAARFQETLEQYKAGPSELHPKALKAMREGIESQLQDLLAEIADYERLRGGEEERPPRLRYR